MKVDLDRLTPRQIVQELDKYIVGQEKAKKAVAIALRNGWRRSQVDEPLRSEITPKNILMIGPTGVGKTEIARRVARLANAPFIKVEATKFTEVGYVGRDVDTIVRDLVETAIKDAREQAMRRVADRAADAAEERILDVLLPPARNVGFHGDAVSDRYDHPRGQDARTDPLGMVHKRLILRHKRPAPRDDLDLELELRGALDAGALRIHLQPVVDARNGVLVGAEALVRWPHPTRGMVPPNAFLPLASRASLIERIDENTLRLALREMSAWRGGPSVAVNLSAASMLRADLLELVADLCAVSKVPPARLTFEVTEHDVVSDFERGRRRIAALREMGCRIAIDDFGTGYSSLRYLAQLPITGIKVDRSFVERLADDPRAHALVQALVGMAASLQLSVSCTVTAPWTRCCGTTGGATAWLSSP